MDMVRLLEYVHSQDTSVLTVYRFNRIGNREMYMNCAVVNITNKKGKRDTQANAVEALSKYPDLFVANLANINSCKIPETTDVIFDNPGKQVSYGNGDSASSQASFGKGQCTAKGSKSAGKATSPKSSGGGSNSGGGNSGNNGQWTPPTTSKPSDCDAANMAGLYVPDCYAGGNSRSTQQQQQVQQVQQQQNKQQEEQPSQDAPKPDSTKPKTKVQEELDAYLATLYGSRLARRNMAVTADYKPKKEYSAQPPKHTEDCKHKPSEYPPGSHYHNTEDLDPYPEDGTDYSNKNVYSTQDSQYHEDPDSAYKRTARQKRWTSYTKRADAAAALSRYSRGGDETSSYYQQQASTQASAEASAQASTQSSTQTSDDTSVQKVYGDMSPQEKFEAYLRRMVELSQNMESLIKYAAASTVNVPYYPQACTYSYTGCSSNSPVQSADAARKARRGVVTMYPGPAVGSISAPGEATDADDGFKAWFPNLVQGLMTKRQLVDPVTSEASAEHGDGIHLFDALLASFWKAFGDPFNLYGDDLDSESESDPDTSDIPLVLGEPDFYSKQPGLPDFDIPDLDGGFLPPPQVLAPEPPVPELDSDWPSEPSIIVSIEPVDESAPTDASDPTDGFPDTLWDTPRPIWPNMGDHASLDDDSNDGASLEAPDASGRRPRPGMSHPLIPYPLPDNFTGPYPANSTTNVTGALQNSTTSSSNGTFPPVEVQPYQNKTLGELISNILSGESSLGAEPSEDAPVDDAPAADSEAVGPSLTPVPSNSSDDAPWADEPSQDQPSEETNPLQEAADQAEEGVTVPEEPVTIDPNALETIADALPWFMGPGPVVTSDVPPEEGQQ